RQMDDGPERHRGGGRQPRPLLSPRGAHPPAAAGARPGLGAALPLARPSVRRDPPLERRSDLAAAGPPGVALPGLQSGGVAADRLRRAMRV
ncbi:MAG: hypothetical protein AVDCRST_MAG59-2126, partial [uncultured Thermomicrobiales bacterium]